MRNLLVKHGANLTLRGTVFLEDLKSNGTNNVVGQVQGDHGDYQTEIGRDDPNSRAITTWQCECPWDQFAWQRTRQWKKYEGRVCSHVLATYWLSQQLPLDEDAHPACLALDSGHRASEVLGPVASAAAE